MTSESFTYLLIANLDALDPSILNRLFKVFWQQLALLVKVVARALKVVSLGLAR